MTRISLTESTTERTAIANRAAPRTDGPADEIEYGELLASLSTPIAVLDRDGIVAYANEAWRSWLDEGVVPKAAQSVIGCNYLAECRRAEARGRDGARELRQGIEAVLARRMMTFRGEYRSQFGDRWYEAIVDALKHGQGGVAVSFVDLTERWREQKRAENGRRHVAHLGRTAMMGEIASALAHEIRQPVTAVRLNALAGATLLGSPRTSFEEVWSDSREAWQMFKDIYDDASRACAVIEHIHQHVRRQGAHGTIVDLGETCRTVAKLLDHEATLRGARIELDLDAELPPVVGDAIELQQIVMSLATNALDAVATSPERVVRLGTAARGAEVELYVRDTGPGISPSVRQHLFESFFTTKETGLGMGLMVARAIAERHRGRLSAEDAGDRRGGAVFRVQLPIS